MSFFDHDSCTNQNKKKFNLKFINQFMLILFKKQNKKLLYIKFLKNVQKHINYQKQFNKN